MLKIRDALENSDATSGDMGKWMAPFDFRSSNRSIKLSNGVLIVVKEPVQLRENGLYQAL